MEPVECLWLADSQGRSQKHLYKSIHINKSSGGGHKAFDSRNLTSGAGITQTGKSVVSFSANLSNPLPVSGTNPSWGLLALLAVTFLNLHVLVLGKREFCRATSNVQAYAFHSSKFSASSSHLPRYAHATFC